MDGTWAIKDRVLGCRRHKMSGCDVAFVSASALNCPRSACTLHLPRARNARSVSACFFFVLLQYFFLFFFLLLVFSSALNHGALLLLFSRHNECSEGKPFHFVDIPGSDLHCCIFSTFIFCLSPFLVRLSFLCIPLCTPSAMLEWCRHICHLLWPTMNIMRSSEEIADTCLCLLLCLSSWSPSFLSPRLDGWAHWQSKTGVYFSCGPFFFHFWRLPPFRVCIYVHFSCVFFLAAHVPPVFCFLYPSNRTARNSVFFFILLLAFADVATSACAFSISISIFNENSGMFRTSIFLRRAN